MKLIFLDIDGVLNCRPDNWKDIPEPIRTHMLVGFHPPLVKNLKKIIDATDAKIVVSSSWRHFEDAPYEGADWRKTLADMLNVDKSIFIGNTPEIVTEYEMMSTGRLRVRRGKEIETWLLENPCFNRQFVVLDDEVCDIVTVIPKKFVVHTKQTDGLTEEDADKAIRILNDVR